MKKIFIFGDSFSIDIYRKESWVSFLREKYGNINQIINLSLGGIGCSTILNRLEKQIDKINPTDFVIICWSDMNRESDLQNLESKQIIKTKYTNILSSAKNLLEVKKIDYLCIWGFPSDYGKTQSWIDISFNYINYKDYEYVIDFKNEIRPALIYFSRREFVGITNSKELEKLFMYDDRPNHIGNLNIHFLLFTLVEKFIEKEISGIHYLHD